jgi:ABC-type nitrate/sulfonate/bicarbonate transport system permease component
MPPTRLPYRRSGRLRYTGAEILVSCATVALVWVYFTSSTNFALPDPSAILEAFRVNWLTSNISTNGGPSVIRFVLGYAAAVFAGAIMGILLGSYRRFRLLCTPVFDFIRSTPAIALLPLFIAVLGVGDGMKIFYIFLASWWVILFNVMDGVGEISNETHDAARAYGIVGWERIAAIVLPAVAPRLMAGMRTALASALVLLVVAEMTAGQNGIGFLILHSQTTFAFAAMWSGVLLLGIVGYVLNLGFVVAERRVLRWHPGFQRGRH